MRYTRPSTAENREEGQRYGEIENKEVEIKTKANVKVCTVGDLLSVGQSDVISTFDVERGL